MSVRDQAAALEKIAGRIGRLPLPDRLNPHCFHEACSDLRRDIRAVAQWLLTGHKPAKLESDDVFSGVSAHPRSTGARSPRS